jgi:class I fructose-bisphosphate aldolase
MEVTDTAHVRDDIQQIAAGGAHGSIIGRNAFKRPRAEALKLLQDIQGIYSAARS